LVGVNVCMCTKGVWLGVVADIGLLWLAWIVAVCCNWFCLPC